MYSSTVRLLHYGLRLRKLAARLLLCSGCLIVVFAKGACASPASAVDGQRAALVRADQLFEEGQKAQRSGTAQLADDDFFKCYKIRRRLLGLRDVRTLVCVANLGNASGDRITRRKFAATIEDAYRASRVSLAPESPLSRGLAFDFGSVLWDQDRFKESEEVLRQAILGSVPTSNSDRISLAAWRELAAMIASQGRLSEAMTIDEQTSEAARIAYDEDDFIALSAKYDLGVDLEASGQFQRAEQIFRDVAKKYDGPSGQPALLLETLSELANALDEEGKREEAWEVQSAVVRAQSNNAVRDDDLDALTFRIRLAKIEFESGDIDHAGRDFQAVYDAPARLLGPDAPGTIRAQFGLAEIAFGRGNLRQGESLLAHIADSLRDNYGPGYPDSIRSRGLLGCTRAHLLGDFSAGYRDLVGASAETWGRAQNRRVASEFSSAAKILSDSYWLFDCNIAADWRWAHSP